MNKQAQRRIDRDARALERICAQGYIDGVTVRDHPAKDAWFQVSYTRQLPLVATMYGGHRNGVMVTVDHMTEPHHAATIAAIRVHLQAAALSNAGSILQDVAPGRWTLSPLTRRASRKIAADLGSKYVTGR